MPRSVTTSNALGNASAKSQHTLASETTNGQPQVQIQIRHREVITRWQSGIPIKGGSPKPKKPRKKAIENRRMPIKIKQYEAIVPSSQSVERWWVKGGKYPPSKGMKHGKFLTLRRCRPPQKRQSIYKESPSEVSEGHMS